MAVSLEGRVALRELMARAWLQVQGQAQEMLERRVEGLLQAERDALYHSGPSPSGVP